MPDKIIPPFVPGPAGRVTPGVSRQEKAGLLRPASSRRFYNKMPLGVEVFRPRPERMLSGITLTPAELTACGKR